MQLAFSFLQWHFESRQTDRRGNILFSSLHLLLSPHLSSSDNNSGQRQEWSSCVCQTDLSTVFFFFSTLTQRKSPHWTKLAACIYLWWNEFCKNIIIRKIVREWRCLPPALVTTQTVTNNDHVSTNMLIVSRGGKYWSKSTSLLLLK